MIHLNLRITNPFSDMFDTIKSWAGSTPFANKFWEFQIYRDNSLVYFDFGLTTRQDHAGMRLCLGLFGYCADFLWYDNRHWNYYTQEYHQPGGEE